MLADLPRPPTASSQHRRAPGSRRTLWPPPRAAAAPPARRRAARAMSACPGSAAPRTLRQRLGADQRHLVGPAQQLGGGQWLGGAAGHQVAVGSGWCPPAPTCRPARPRRGPSCRARPGHQLGDRLVLLGAGGVLGEQSPAPAPCRWRSRNRRLPVIVNPCAAAGHPHRRVDPRTARHRRASAARRTDSPDSAPQSGGSRAVPGAACEHRHRRTQPPPSRRPSPLCRACITAPATPWESPPPASPD